jgi:hypothetical protein
LQRHAGGRVLHAGATVVAVLESHKCKTIRSG